MPTPISELLRQWHAEFIRTRQDIHQHPELAFAEHRTADLVAERLNAWGYSVHRNIGGTGVVGQLRLGSSHRSMGIRADMDALPITEDTGLAYASQHPGTMHACGHDGHTALLLAAARVLAQRRHFDGTLNLIFQPAEETGQADSGAPRMLNDGLFERFACDAIFGLHNMPGLPQGHFAFRDGAMMASSDKVVIVLHGKGGHGASPHLAHDPVVAAASVVMALQTVVSRNVDPRETAVVTVGVIQAGAANNVIPGSARLELTVRALDAQVRTLLQERITALVLEQAHSLGCRAEIDYRPGYPALVNSAAETQLAREVALALVGAEQVVEQTPVLTGSEDFAFMLQQRPGCFLLIGNGVEADKCHAANMCSVHNPGYDFNDANVLPGASFWAHLAEHYLRVEPTSAAA